MTDDRDAPGAVTQWLLDLGRNDKVGLDHMLPVVYDELHRLATQYLGREATGHTLQPTALVNEAYLRLVDRKRVSWRDRTHFFAFAATTMRRILVESARKKRSAKRDAGAGLLTLTEAEGIAGRDQVDVIHLDHALTALAALDERQARLVELRYFGGLTIDETAEVLEVGPATVSRDWATAKAFLYRQLSG
jgi:RNA polymerase sigma factor (TIGR02999 family)